MTLQPVLWPAAGPRWELTRLRLTKVLAVESIALVTASRPVLNSPESRYSPHPTTGADTSANASRITNRGDHIGTSGDSWHPPERWVERPPVAGYRCKVLQVMTRRARREAAK